jgi:hypothetical protein
MKKFLKEKYVKKVTKNILMKFIMLKIWMRTFDEDEVLISSLPLDEDIQASTPPAHQEENMMSHDPFEELDDALFHDCGSEEVLEDPLDMTYPFEKRKTKHFAVRIKPRVMKRRWKSMPMKRKKNLDEVQHVEASLSFLPPDEVEVVQPCSPPVHEVEEATSLNDEEFEDPVEAPSLCSSCTRRQRDGHFQSC